MIKIKKYMKMNFIIIIFSLIVFTFSIVSSILISDYKIGMEADSFQNENMKSFKFTESNTINFNEMISILDAYTESEIYLEYDPIPKVVDSTTLFGRGIYYNYDVGNDIPILEGRNFTVEEMNSSDKKIVVGKNLTSYIVEEGGEKYFNIKDETFRVIGILGSEERKTGYDDTFFINLKSSNEFSDSRAVWNLNVSNQMYFDNILNEYEQLANKNNIDINIDTKDKDLKKINLIESIKMRPEFISILIMAFSLGLINLIIVVYYWMDKNIKEIGIRKAYGGTNFKISMHILKQYELSVLISVIIGVFSHLTLKSALTRVFPMFEFELYYENIIAVTVLFMLIGLVVALIPLIRAKKIQPSIIMKGNLK